ncbi:hypothetical protein EV2_009838 [Malus domestica]
MDVLHISFDGLRETEKEIFLHIACFFKGKDRVRVTEILNYCRLYPEIGLTILSEKSLVTFSGNKLEMHGLLQEMGWQIVSRESATDPGKRSRLWSHEDIHNVLTKNKGTNVVQGIVMELPKLEVAHWNPEAFSNLSQLRFLQVHNVHPSQGLTCLPESLRLLEWTGYPLRSLPQYFQPDELIELNLCHSNLDQLWKGIKRFPKLKFIKICHSHHISETPDFTGVQELESLDLEGCKNLVGIHQSLGLLKKLTLLNLKDCESLESLPGKIEMESLETFILSGCLKVKQVPEFGNMQLLSALKLNETAIETIPESIEHLSGLVTLDLSNCKDLVCLPSTINRLKSLKNLNLSGCLKLGEEQESMSEVECLEKIDDSRTAETEVPNFGVMQKVKKEPVTFWSPSFGLWSLTDLNLSNCELQEGSFLNGLGVLSSLVALNLSGNNFVSLPLSIRSLVKLESINIENCKRLTELSGLPSNSKLDVRADGCSSLEIFNTSELNVLEKSYFNFLNCFKLNDNQSLLNMTFEMLKKFLHRGTSSARETFQIAIPGSEIPKWFSHQNDVGSSLTIDLPPLWNKSKFMGYALCAVFVLDEHCVVDEHDTFQFKTFHATHHLVCRLKHNGKQLEVCGTQPAFRFSEKFCQVDSDHLWMFYVSRDRYFGTDWHNSCSQIEFLFETRGPGLKVKKCGVRLMYEQDVGALQSESATVNTSIFPVEEDVINMIDDNVTHTSSDMTLHQREWQLVHSNGFSHSVGINEDITKRASSDSFLQWTQWQLLDSILPTGGFTHSFGLEAAIQAHVVSSPKDLQTFIIRLLENTGSLLLPFVYSTTISPNLETTRKLDKMLDAMLTDEVVRKASISKGTELMRVAAAVYAEIPSVTSTMEACLSSGDVSFHHAHAFGLICGLLGLDSTTTQRAYMFITMRDVISAATRLNLVGPLGAAVLQHKIASGAAEAILNRWKDRPVEEASQALSLPQI